jgi:hypothetical protein
VSPVSVISGVQRHRLREEQLGDVRLGLALGGQLADEADPTHDHATMPGRQTDTDMAALAAARGSDFDRHSSR